MTVALKKDYIDANAEKFLSGFTVGNDKDCWEWQAGCYKDGYGGINIKGQKKRTVKAHRYSYEYFIGPIPQGMCVMHKCDNPKCINPSHLSVGTHLQNMRDRDSKRRSPFGENHPNAKLTEAKVLEIKSLLNDGESLMSVSLKYGVHKSHIYSIKSGLRWSHVS